MPPVAPVQVARTERFQRPKNIFENPFKKKDPFPNNKPTRGRNRNTVKNANAGGTTADPFPLRPTDQSAVAIQRSNLHYQARIARATLKAQAALTRQMYRRNVSDIQEQARTEMGAVGGDAADRGILSSSVRIAGEQDVRGAADAAIADARMERNQALLGIATSRLEARARLRLGLSELALNKAAMQKELALTAFGGEGRNPWGY